MIPQEATPLRELRVLARVMGQEQAWGALVTGALPDLFPGLGGQVKDPEVPVVVELLSIRRGKLPAEDPELSAALGHRHSL